ncbi:MAG: DNA primase [Phycisphaerales bacterium]
MNSEHPGSSDVERVRDATDIARIVGECVDLKPRGREYVGLCPFHDDRKPSMYVVPAKQIYHCFVCNAGGDAFTFVQNYHKMTFGEALRYLAEKAGVKLTERTRRRTRDDDQHAVARSVLLEANERALAFFRSVLRHADHGRDARALIESRGIAPDMVEAFGIGAAPDRWDGLLLYLQNKDIDPAPFEALGLLKQRDAGPGRYDALRNRLVFPIRDRIGRTIAFGARRVDDHDEPKYLNSPESPLFDKSATLFGLDLASRAIQRAGTAVIAEGYTDVIACHQAGITNVVATLGTALTPRHAAMLQQLCHTVVLLFDGDEAGQRAADRAAEVFLALPIDVRIATLAGRTQAKDPDELLKTDGGAAVLQRVFDEAVELLEFRYSRLSDELQGAGPARLEARIKQELRDLGRLGLARADKVRWQFVIRRLHDLTALDPATIAQLVREGAGRAPRAEADAERDAGSDASPTPGAIPRSPTSEAVGCLLLEPSLYLGLEDPQREALRRAAALAGLEDALAAVEAAADDSRSPRLADVLTSLRERRIDPAPVIALEQDVAARLADHEAVADTLRRCLHRIQIELTPPAPASGSVLDRIAELKARRTGDNAVDRTRLPSRPGAP